MVSQAEESTLAVHGQLSLSVSIVGVGDCAFLCRPEVTVLTQESGSEGGTSEDGRGRLPPAAAPAPPRGTSPIALVRAWVGEEPHRSAKSLGQSRGGIPRVFPSPAPPIALLSWHCRAGCRRCMHTATRRARCPLQCNAKKTHERHIDLAR